MTLEDIKEYLHNKRILHFRRGHLSLNPMYKLLLDDESKSIIDDWMKDFRNEKEGWWCLIHDMYAVDRPRCPMCGKVAKFAYKYYNLTCGECNYNDYGPKKDKVAASTTEESIRRGREKYEETCLRIYGVKNPNQFTTPEMKAAYVARCQEKHGTNNAVQSKEAREKYKRTMLERHGVDHNFKMINSSEKLKKVWEEQHDKIIEKIKMTSILNHGTEFPTQSKEVQEKMIAAKNSKSLKIEQEYNCVQQSKLIELYGQGWLKFLRDGTIVPLKFGKLNNFIKNEDVEKIKQYTSTPHDIFSISEAEKELRSYVHSIYDGEIKHNDRTTISTENKRYEMDIYVPEKNVAFEYDGVYWHSIEIVDKNYQLNKSIAAKNKGIRMLHIFEDEWINSTDICKSIISSSLGIYQRTIPARKCNFIKLTSEDYRNFCDENHIQGSINSKYKYGLSYKDEIVQVIGIGQSRFKKNELEIHRMCTKKFTNVIGGFSKLMSHIKEELSNEYDILYSYVDLSKFTGNGYESVGFEYVSTSKPSYFYIKGLKRYNRIQFQKHKLKNLLEHFDESKTEQENMIDNNYLCVYDCGTKKYKYNLKN